MSAWKDLPNAVHIGRVIVSLREHSQIWSKTRSAALNAAMEAAWNAAYNAAYDAGRFAAYEAAYEATYDAVLDEVWDAAWSVALNAARGAARSAAFEAARAAILALIAYDDCEQYLSMTSEELKAWVLLTEHPTAILLLPAVIAFERIAKLETV